MAVLTGRVIVDRYHMGCCRGALDERTVTATYRYGYTWRARAMHTVSKESVRSDGLARLEV